MASSLPSGDRRWAPTRKGMTVLGKVPKPINLPSQRLENHGLDPNVEIVPKGTLTWGSRPSPTTPNAWGLSNHSSPNADGGIDSPSGLNGRPSSSGSGTRPSTAGSDWSSERVTSAWKSNSRPSSASGSLASNHTQLVARPQSAETRPGSSQLSRFADSATGHSGPWGSAGIAQKTGPASPGTGDFVLSSGDFPTIGLEKSSGLHHEHESKKPTLTTASMSTEKDRLDLSQTRIEKLDVHTDKGNANSWKTESTPNTGDATSSIDSWCGNHPNMQLTPNVNTAQSLSNPWHMHPRNPSDGAWCRDLPPGGPYRLASSVPSGNYQPDPYPSAQIPQRLGSNLHSAPRAAGHAAEYQNEHGEGFRPHHPPETFMVPTMPIIPVRPGVYRGPVPYDSRYVPSAEFGGPNIRERPVMDFAPNPTVSNQFRNEPCHQGPFQVPARPSGHTQLSNGKIENTRHHEFASGQYKVLLKHHNHPVAPDSEGSRDQTTASKAALLDKDGNEQGPRQKIILDELRNSPTGETLRSNSLQACSHGDYPPNSSEKLSERVVDDMIKNGDSLIASAEVKHPSTKNTKLIEKIETLNNKTRVADGRTEGLILTKAYSTKRADDGNPTYYHLRKNVPHGTYSGGSSGMEPPILMSDQHDESAISSTRNISECTSTIKAPPVPSQTLSSTFVVSSSSDGNNKSQAEYTRRTQNMQGKGPVSKSTIVGEENNYRTRQVFRNDSLVNPNNNSIRDELLPEEASSFQIHGNRLGSLHMNKSRDESYVPSSLDSADYQVQRAKMKEIALQRAKQLQQEEEELIREQKAKALAKLEELNRRTLFENSNKDAAGESPHPNASMDAAGCNFSSSTETENNARGSTAHTAQVDKTSGDIPNKNDGPAPPESSHPERASLKHKNVADIHRNEEPSLLLTDKLPDMGFTKLNASDTDKNKATETPYLDSPKDCQDSGSFAGSSYQIAARKNVHLDSFKKNNTQFHDNSSLSKRQVSHRRKQNVSEGRIREEAAAPDVDVAGSETLMEVATESSSAGKLTSTQSNETFNSSTQQRRNERSGKNKTESQYAARIDLSLTVQSKGILEKPADIHEHKNKMPLDETIPPISNSEKSAINQNISGSTGSSDHGVFQATGGSAKVTNQGKSNHSRRPSRNGQSRPLDKFQGNENAVWAPIRSSKGELAAESQRNQHELHAIGNSSTKPSGVDDNSSNSKSKRAEIQRYVPKVVKDGPQEGNSLIPDGQIPVQTAITDNVAFDDKKEVGFTKSDSATIRRSAEQTQTNKHGKNNGTSASWRQRSSQDGPSDAVSSGMSFSGQKQLQGASSHGNAARSTDALLMQSDLSKEPLGIADPKEPENTSKSKRQIQKVHKVVPADAKDSAGEITCKLEVQPSASDWNVKSVTAESLNVERAKSQWKPKSQTMSSNNNEQNTGHIDEKASQSVNRDHDSSVIKDQHGRVPDKNILGKAANMDGRRHQPRRDRKEFVPENHNDEAGHNAEQYQGQPSSSSGHQKFGTRHMKGKDMRHGGRLGKSHDNTYADTRQHLPINGDRQRQNCHYEYQRIEARASSNQFQTFASSNRFQTVASSRRDVPGASEATGPRFREKTQGYKRGGSQFYVRSSESCWDDKPSDGQ